MNTDTKLLDVQHVTVEFHTGNMFSGTRIVAVNDISFSLEEDKPEIYTLAGESGSGKTTLSRLLLRDLDPTTGNVFFRRSQSGDHLEAERLQGVYEEGSAGVPEPV